jgi:UPF0755 protein
VVKRLFFLLLVSAVLAGGLLFWGRQRMQTPYRGFAGDEVFVEIEPGMGVGAIANRLAAAGVIPDRWTFRFAARLGGDDRSLQAGEYRFAEAATPQQVLGKIRAGETYKRPVTFPEGLTIVEMSRLFETGGLGPAEDFIGAADPSLIESIDAGARSLEGYLFPDTYTMPRRAGAAGLVRAMVARFDRAFDAELRQAAAAAGLTLREAVTLASLIEKETGKPEERALVSSVYHNRLRIGMPLQCDPTVIYALMLAKRWNGNLRKVDLEMDSPYNTYRVRGLPPTPIASPGRAALEAAVRPAQSKYLYFVSRNDGSHVFASTLAEHNRNVNQYQKRRKP